MTVNSSSCGRPHDRGHTKGAAPGVIKRARKKDLWLLLWTLILGFSIGSKRTLTGLYQEYNEHAKETVSFSSFQGWLSEELAAFLKHLCIEAIGETCGRKRM